MRIIQSPAASEHEPPTASLAIQDGSSIFHVVAVDAAALGAPGALLRLLLGGVTSVLAGGSERAAWPRSLASRIAERLAARAPGDPDWILFASALVTKDAVHVCTAGHIRVRLVQGGAVVRATRDHVLANEPTDWVRATYGDVDVALHGGVITRSLGACSLPPEADVWPAAPPFTLLVGSTASHDGAGGGDRGDALARIEV